MISIASKKSPGKSGPAIYIIFALLALALTGCSSPEKEESYNLTAAQEKIAEGKAYLAQNRYFEAYDSFADARELDESNEEARFGQALSRTGELVDNVQALVGLALVVVQDLPIRGDLPSLSYVDENEYIVGLIEDVLNIFVDPAVEIMQICEELQDSPGFKFNIEQFEISVFSYPMLRLSGEWDRADVMALQAGVGMFAALFNIVTGYSLSMDLYDIYDMALVMFDQDTFNTPNVLNLVAQLLTDEQYPNFLGLDEDDENGDGVADGIERHRRAADYLQRAFTSIVAVPQLIAAETDDQSDDIFVSSNALSSWATSRIGLAGRLVLRDGKLIILTEGEYGDIFVGLGDLGLAAIANMADNLGGDAAEDGHVRIKIEDVLEVLVEVAISLLPYIDLGSISDVIEPYTAMLNDPSTLVSLVSGFIPADIELDLGDFLRDPAGLNAILPPVRSDLDPDVKSLLLEFECMQWIPAYAEIGSIDYLPNGSAFCPRYDEDEDVGYTEDDFALTDEVHFSDDFYTDLGIASMVEDGFTSIMPIIPFRDPTLAGLIWIDGTDMDIASSTGMEPASNLTLNALIARAVGQFLD